MQTDLADMRERLARDSKSIRTGDANAKSERASRRRVLNRTLNLIEEIDQILAEYNKPK